MVPQNQSLLSLVEDMGNFSFETDLSIEAYFQWSPHTDLRLYFKGEMFKTAKFIAYLQNLVISVSFVSMFYSHRSIEGQSFTIAWTKWLGTSMTVGISYLFVEHPDNWYFMGVIIGTTFILVQLGVDTYGDKSLLLLE